MKTIASIATYKPRIIKVVWDAVQSLLPQVDELHLVVNCYPALDALDLNLAHSAINALTQKYGDKIKLHYERSADLGDLSKFRAKDYVAENDLWLICDDDLIYPPDYAKKCRAIAERKPAAIMSYGGKTLRKGPYFDYRNAWKDRYSVFEGNEECRKIQIPLTCVTFGYGRNFEGLIIHPRYRNKGDLLIARHCIEREKLLVCPPFAAGWIGYNQRMVGRPTIWDDMRANPASEKEIADILNEFFQEV